MKKILHVYPQLNCGGTEMVFYNLIKFGDRSKFQYDILVQSHGSDEERFKDLGCKIHVVAYHNKKDYIRQLDIFFHENYYDVIHTHVHSEIPYLIYAAKNANIPCRIVHSHNSRIDIPKWLWPIATLRHRKYEKGATAFFGCSELALKWLFPTRWKDGVVINNGIDLNAFSFDEGVRETIRESYSISPETKVYLNVGRLAHQKNQKFILQLAEQRRKYNELFLLIGDGPDYDELVKYKNKNQLDKVIFLGRRNDVSRWMNAADVFLFPSYYEGLGIVAIEAQASGMPVITTEKIPNEADLNIGIFHKLSLKDSEGWHHLMSEGLVDNVRRGKISRLASKSDYDIKMVAKYVEKFYRENS